MNIIEKEIQRRKDLIQSNKDKIVELELLAKRFESLKREIQEFNEEQMESEIRELETYLPKVEQPVEQPTIQY